MTIKVDYLDKLGNDLTPVNAARCSFNKFKTNFDDTDKKLLDYLARNDHWSPYSHAYVQVRVTAPLFVARQAWKSHVGVSGGDAGVPAWNEVSRRYVDLPPDYFHPMCWRSKPKNRKQGSGAKLGDAGQLAADFVYLVGIKASDWSYKLLLKLGVAPEQARMVVPQAMVTTWWWTGSLAFWARFCNLRMDDHAQGEIQQLAQRINDICGTHFPNSWEALRYE